MICRNTSGWQRAAHLETLAIRTNLRLRVMVLHIRRAVAGFANTVARILVVSTETSFPDTINEHDRDVPFWTRR